MLGRYRLLLIVTLATAVLDQGTKALALSALGDGEVVPLLGEAVELRLRRNPGVGWSLFAGASESVQRVVFPAVGLLLGIVLLWLYRRLREEERLLRTGVALMVGGGLGNLVDRLRLGQVVDFVTYHIGTGGSTMTGTFNVADVGLVVGVALVAVGVLGRRRQAEVAPEEDAR